MRNIRNLHPSKLELSATSNLIVGPNGSGKTSVLESISILSQGKSFRKTLKRSVIRDGQDSLVVAAEVAAFGEYDADTRIGISKYTTGKTIAKMAGEKIKRISDITAVLPVCVVEPNSMDILEGSPSTRRQFLDWGVFHVEHSFVNHWKNFSSALKQRNALLKNKTTDLSQLHYWDKVIAPEVENISRLRSKYFEELSVFIGRSLDEFLSTNDFSFTLDVGWEGSDYLSVLESNRPRDIRYGYTTVGPHKAEMFIKCNGHDAKDYLSRGQKKLAVYALKLAQVEHFQSRSSKKVSLLLDDLPSELDKDNCIRVCEKLKKLDSQVFITSIDSKDLTDMLINSLAPKMFHVKHGVLSSNYSHGGENYE